MPAERGNLVTELATIETTRAPHTARLVQPTSDLSKLLSSDRRQRLGLDAQVDSPTPSTRTHETQPINDRYALSCELSYALQIEHDEQFYNRPTDPALARRMRERFERFLPQPVRAAGIGELEKAFRRIGVWSGTGASKLERQQDFVFWQSTGKFGLYWLIARLRDERSLQVLNGVAELLSAHGAAVVKPILRELRRTPTTYQTYALLTALGWIGGYSESDDLVLNRTIREFLNHPNSDVREAAAAATVILPVATARKLLSARILNEADEMVRATLSAELQDRDKP